MIEVSAECAKVTSAMTLVSAKLLLENGSKLIGGNVTCFDLGAVTEVDSSGLAVVFGWLREAKRLGKAVHVVNLPKSLSSLAEVYGVSDLLPDIVSVVGDPH
jgi:phospholipid transport system transporter-binding protein